MTVLSVAYPLFPVCEDSSGGAEQILYLLDREIVRAGHRSVVIAAEGSEISGELIATQVVDGQMTDEVRAHAQGEHRAAILKALASNSEVDVVHFHGLDFATYLPETRVPQLATLHLPLAWYPAAALTSNVRFVCVSDAQALHIDFCVVHNGVDTSKYGSKLARRDYLLWLGRICPEKGVHIALRVAHKIDVELVVAGPVHDFETHQRYFREEVSPLLDERRRYVGQVGGEQKLRLLEEARCLLVPSLVAETSSLVAMEAISAGTPVVAFRSGALPEIVDHGITGYVVDSEDEMTEAVRRVSQISSDTSRQIARERFSCQRMASQYLELYRVMKRGAA